MSSPSVQKILERKMIEDRFGANRKEMMSKPTAYIAADVHLVCPQKKINERLLYIPPTTSDSTFFTVDVGVALPKGSALKPYLDFV